ncbi:MAG: SpoIIE family protein phosphatase, partial [Thermoanaerobaculia bacterium]
MNARLKFAVTLAATLLAVAAVVVMAMSRFSSARERGTAGLSYVGQSNEKQPDFLGFSPGKVMLTYPGLPADRAGIRSGDRIVSINGIPIIEADRLRTLDRSVRSGDVVTYRIQRNGREQDIEVRFASSLHTPLVAAYIAVHGLVALCFLGIGLLIYTSKQGDRRVSVLFAMTTVGGLSIFGTMLMAIDNTSLRGIDVSPSASLMPLALVGIFIVAFIPLTLHLALIFPRERPLVQKYPSTIRWVYVVPFVGLLLALLVGSLSAALQSAGKPAERWIDIGLDAFMTSVSIVGLLLALRLVRLTRSEGWGAALWRRPGHTSMALFGAILGAARIAGALKLKAVAFSLGILTTAIPTIALLLYPVITCVVLYRSYRDAGAEERRQVKWPLWGTFIALVTKILFAVVMNGFIWYLMLTGQDVSSWVPVTYGLQLIPTVVYLLIPISFAAAILKYRLMNIDLLIRKTVVYAILSGVIIVAYLVLVGGLGTMLVAAVGMKNQTMVIASTLVVALFFVPVRNKLQTLVERNLFRQRFAYSEVLAALAAEARSASDSQAFLSSAAEKIQQALQNRAVVMFVERHDELVATAKIGVPDSVLGTLRIPSAFAETLHGPTDLRQGVQSEDAVASLRKVSAEIVVPLGSRGLMSIAPKLSGSFEPEDLEFIGAAAESLGTGIDRIRMQVDEVDFEQAREIQQSLLPRSMPQVKGIDVSGIWQPARSVGGDYYDLLELSDTMLAVCIGDVAGKGMPAAILMSGLQAAVRASATPTTSPREVCERVRRVVVSSLSGGRFVTFFFAVIDTASMQIRWCNAGHNAPILVRGDGSVERLETGGPVLSRLSRNAVLEEGARPIAAGDRLVLFTDGVSE